MSGYPEKKGFTGCSEEVFTADDMNRACDEVHDEFTKELERRCENIGYEIRLRIATHNLSDMQLKKIATAIRNHILVGLE